MGLDAKQIRQLPINMIPLAVRSGDDQFKSGLGDFIIKFYRRACAKDSVIPVGDRIISERQPYMKWFIRDTNDEDLYQNKAFRDALSKKKYKALVTIGRSVYGTLISSRQTFVFYANTLTMLGTYTSKTDSEKSTKDKLLFSFVLRYPTTNYLLLSFLCFRSSSSLPIDKSQKPKGITSSSLKGVSSSKVFEVQKDFCITSFLYNHFPKKAFLGRGLLFYHMDESMLKSVEFLPGEEFYHLVYPSPVEVIGAFEAQAEYPFVHCGGWIETKHWLGGVVTDVVDKFKGRYKVMVKGRELTIETLDFFEYAKGDYVIILKKSSRFSKMFSDLDGWSYASPISETDAMLLEMELTIAPFWLWGRRKKEG